MGFFLYKYALKPNGDRKYWAPQQIRLAGKYGPIAKHVLSKISQPTKPPLTWHLSASDLKLLSGLSQTESSNYAIVIDLKPKEQKSVELYLLQDIWGYSEDLWTPIALRLEELPVSSKQQPQKVKDSFTVTEYRDAAVIEFLYLRGGIKNDNWGWGPVGSVNGTLLWPDPLRHFLSAIGH